MWGTGESESRPLWTVSHTGCILYIRLDLRGLSTDLIPRCYSGIGEYQHSPYTQFFHASIIDLSTMPPRRPQARPTAAAGSANPTPAPAAAAGMSNPTPSVGGAPSSTVAPAPTTTEVRGATAALGNLNVGADPVEGDAPVAASTDDVDMEEDVAADDPPAPVPREVIDGAPPPLMITQAEVDARFQAFADTIAHAIQVNRPASTAARLSTNDVKLPSFAGSSDASALHIDPAFYLPLIEWVKETRTLLRASGLPTQQAAFAIFNALTGPARRALLLHMGDVDLANTSPDAMLDALVECIPEHGTVFSSQAIEMVFAVNTLRKDVETFGLLVTHGELPADNRFWFSTLTRKLLHAKPDLLTLSASLLNRQLDYRVGERFPQLIARTIDIVTRLEQQGYLVQKAGKGMFGESPGNRNKRKSAPDAEASSKQAKAAKPPGKHHANRGKYLELAKQYSRCTTCGYHYPAAQLPKHQSSCKGTPAQFNSRMSKVMQMVDAGKGDQVNAFGGQKPGNK